MATPALDTRQSRVRTRVSVGSPCRAAGLSLLGSVPRRLRPHRDLCLRASGVLPVASAASIREGACLSLPQFQARCRERVGGAPGAQARRRDRAGGATVSAVFLAKGVA